MKATQEALRILTVGFIGILDLVIGNIISIGPGLYESNHTLDGTSRAVYVLNSCEFMHNGRLQSVHFYAGSSDWLAIQIWRPSGTSSNSGKMKLVYQKYMEVNKRHEIYQVQFDVNEVHVKSGDVVGFTKLNDSFPISYVFHPLQSVDIWYHNIDVDQDFPEIGDVIDFEEMGFPYRFSVTVRFWADIISSPNGVNANENVLLESNKEMDKADYKDWSVSDKHRAEEGLEFVYNVTEQGEPEEIKVEANAENQDSNTDSLPPSNDRNSVTLQNTTTTTTTTPTTSGFKVTDANVKNSSKSVINTTLNLYPKKTEEVHKLNSNMVSSVTPTINPVDKNTEASTVKFMASSTQPNIGDSSYTTSSSTKSILNKNEEEVEEYSSVSSMDSNIGSTMKPQIDKNLETVKNVQNLASLHKSPPNPSSKRELNKIKANVTEKP